MLLVMATSCRPALCCAASLDVFEFARSDRRDAEAPVHFYYAIHIGEHVALFAARFVQHSISFLRPRRRSRHNKLTGANLRFAASSHIRFQFVAHRLFTQVAQFDR